MRISTTGTGSQLGPSARTPGRVSGPGPCGVMTRGSLKLVPGSAVRVAEIAAAQTAASGGDWGRGWQGRWNLNAEIDSQEFSWTRRQSGSWEDPHVPKTIPARKFQLPGPSISTFPLCGGSSEFGLTLKEMELPCPNHSGDSGPPAKLHDLWSDPLDEGSPQTHRYVRSKDSLMALAKSSIR